MESEGDAEPEREPLKFDVCTDGMPEDIAQCVLGIKGVAEKMLYHWKTFPIQLPPPIAVVTEESTPTRKKTINMRDLFIAPSFDELEQVALNTNGELRHLNEKQLSSVQQMGEFEVESTNFPSQVHRWRLSQLLQKGVIRTQAALLCDLALALRLVIITARNRLHSHFFSLCQSLTALVTGCLKLLDVVIGVPSNKAVNLELQLWEERCKHLVAELKVRRGHETALETYCVYVKQKCRQHSMEKYRLDDNDHLPPVPYLFQSPKGIELDLRLFNKDVMTEALPLLSAILEQESKGWFVQFREKCISERKGHGISDEEIEKEVNVLVVDEYIRRVYNAILNSTAIQAIGPVVAMLLVEQAQSVVLMHRALDKVKEKWERTQEELKDCLKAKYPVKSRIGPWMRDQMHTAEDQFMKDNLWTAHLEALALCRDKDLKQAVYFLQRDLNFMKEREPILLQELSDVKNPTRYFQWKTQIWCPKNWLVTRVFQGHAEVIPTRIMDTPTSITSPRSDPNQAVYLVEKEVKRVTNTRYLFWRWVNYCMRTWCWCWSAMFIFGVVIPWCSPLSLRALFFSEPFMPDLELSQVNGSLCPRKSSLTHTLWSMLVALWRHISKARTEFESRPDTGFIGKDMTRHLNRLWNYVLKGVCGTLGILLVFPALCLLVSLCSILIAASAPFWMPVLTLLMHVLGILVYDFDCPDKSKNRLFIILEAVLWRIVICGCLQPIACVLLGFLLCPIAAGLIMVYALLRRGFRSLWDGFMFNVIIKKRGRIPASDSFVARRVAGPGLASNYYYQVKPEQVLAAFEARMELDELHAYKEEVERVIARPQKDYSNFVNTLFRPFSAGLVKEGVYKDLEKQAKELVAAVKEKIEKRKMELSIGLNPTIKGRVKLLSADLKVAIKVASVMLETFYPSHVIHRQPGSEEEFWEHKNFDFRNWKGLASLILCEIFSTSFLTPLEDTDTTFRLEVQHLNLARYITMLRTADITDDLDTVETVNTAKGKIQIDMPFLDVTVFDPGYRSGDNKSKQVKLRRRQPWKRKGSLLSKVEKLCIPLPVPHPSHIAIYVYNREHERDPVPADGELCHRLMKAAELVPLAPCGLDTVIPIDEDNRSETTATPDRQTPDASSVSDSEGGATGEEEEPVRSVVVNMAHIASAEDIVVSEDGTYGTTV